ncbi:hypothetical protein KGA66_20115 [Actinocrinis puniceicyclus]|uniref:VWFA domain-containing protein n=1 Tax=Actinocrinis puniceicyclus TaxID=977794 RepID=A0A8J7WS01_9ACTN|nr:hypothetical protein [Actinocrinis puniceicyclus]MBS2965367.1 hypothetical protein [Actinocrinis puniceicyclus]
MNPSNRHTSGEPVRLILASEPVHRGLSPAKTADPHIAVVYATGFGEVTSFGGRALTWSEKVLSKYRLRYEVDLGDHRRKAQLRSTPLPSQGDAYFFDAVVDVGFRVFDPEQVVRRNVTDALTVVYSALSAHLRPITRRFEITQAADAESEINLRFPRPLRLDEGIEIYYLTVSLSPDPAARIYLQKLVDGRRRLEIGGVEHELAVAATRGGHEIDQLDQQARIAAEEEEQRVLGRRKLDVRALITAHLAKHPDQSAEALDMLVKYEAGLQNQRNLDAQRQSELFRYMVAEGLVQAADVEVLRAQTVAQLETGWPGAQGGQAALTSGSDWDEDLPHANAPAGRVIRSTAQPSGAGQALPVYLVWDESFRHDGYLSAVDEGVRGLMERLSRSSTVSSVLRLAVLGFAAETVVRMPMTTVSGGGFSPRFAAGGPARLARLFEHLLRRIPEDVDPLKAGDLKVNRPTVYLLTAAPAVDDDEWPAALRRLTDKPTFKYAPVVVACALGEGSAQLAQRVASTPAYAFTARPGLAPAEAVSRYLAFLEKAITQLALSQINGSSNTDIVRPDGFLQAAQTRRDSDG